MVVHRVNADGLVAPQLEHTGTEQRDLVEMEDVEVLAREDLLQPSALERRTAREVGGDRREAPYPAAKRVDANVGVVRKLAGRRRPRQGLERVDAVDDRDPMTAPGEFVREVVDEHAVAAEVVGRI